MSEPSFVIWWTTGADCLAIGERLPGRTPAYLRSEYDSRQGRNGRGRLWVSLKLKDCPEDFAVGPWPDTPLGRVLGEHAAGIVIRATDCRHVYQLPGVLTDAALRRI